MNLLKPLGAVLLIFLPALPAAAAPLNNDDFANRHTLPSSEHVDLVIPRPATLTYEPLDPLRRYEWGAYDAPAIGSLWWKWTPPRDGWFTVSVADNNLGLNEEIQVYEGESLERLTAVANGNFNSTGPGNEVTFEAKQGRFYNIIARCSMDRQGVSGGPGRLRIRPSPGPAANHTLATRAVLSGSLPITVKATNFSPVTQENWRLQSMTSTFGNPYGFFYRWGPVLWWEWTCPSDGRFHFRAEGAGRWIYIAQRRTTAKGPAPAGDWENAGTPPVQDGAFTATAGQVFDIAVAFTDDVHGKYGDFSLTLERAEFTLPPNGTPLTAAPLPATVPFRHDDTWRSGPLPENFEGYVDKYYRFTAPELGYYRFKPWFTQPNFQDGQNAVLGDGEIRWFAAGGKALLHYEFYPDYDQRHVLDVSKVEGLQGSDSLAAAVNAGSVQEFTVLGHRGMATLEKGEPGLLPGLPGEPGTGSLWWRWTAPADGWLSRVHTLYNQSHIETWIGDGTLSGLTNRETLDYHVPVDSGTTYYIRAGFSDSPQHAVCATELEFVPRPLNTSWQTALDLGTSRLPSWEPPHRGAGISFNDTKLWFRWTAAETIRAEFDNASIEGIAMVYTDPATGEQLPLHSASGTRLFTTGQTYWFRFGGFDSKNRWALWEDRLTSHGEPATAMVLDPALPVSGTISLRGDEPTPGEQAVIQEIPQDWGPAALVWWKWQAPRTGTIRFQFSSSTSAIFNSYTLSGPSLTNFHTLQRQDQDLHGYYLQVEQGQTYWFAALASSPRSADAVMLELREVSETHPDNDNLTGAKLITGGEWTSNAQLSGTHRGSGAFDPLYLRWLQASLEPGEPPVSLIIGAEGNAIPQTATTWWTWTAHTTAVFKITVAPADSPVRSGVGVPGGINDVTMDLYTGDSLAALQPAALYESFEGRYLFRATAGTRYFIRVASGADRAYYTLQTIVPWPEEVFDYHAIERLRFEEVGMAFARLTPDDAPNYIKLVFGMDYLLPFNHPANQAAAAGRLPRAVETNGYAELRCRPDPRFLPAGAVVNLPLFGQYSSNLSHWHFTESFADEATGERYLRLDPAMFGGSRLFLRWDLRAGL